MLMKRILRFLTLRIDLNRTYSYVADISVYNIMIYNFVYAVFNYIMPIKSERLNTKIYIFERYSDLCFSFFNINILQFIFIEIVHKPVLQKK